MNHRFPYNEGFTYNEVMDEWEKPTIDGKLIIWEKPNNYEKWVLSYEDIDEYLHPICEGYEHNIRDGLKSIERDKKIDELLNS